MSDQTTLRGIEPVRQPSVADQVFESLYRQVVTLDLPPGARLSEAEVARRLGTSRQPVRDAFYRLSQLGFLVIRPQRSTTVSRISEAAVLQARFVRTALEIETVRVAAEVLDAAAFARLDALVAEQEAAVAAGDKLLFHALDDEFHRQICALSSLEFAWSLIRENKAHMDRVRYLSLAFGAEAALADHRDILAALKASDGARAIAEMRGHLSRIETIIGRIRADHGDYFDPA
jgi:GntR family transcriptional regulator, rspAB operon transcriptional repressor